MSKVIYDKKKYNQTYNKKLAEQEVYCDACCIKVKLISMPRHKQSKKHIEKANKQTSNLKEEVLALLNHKNPKKSDDDILKDIYYLIQAQYFNEEGEEVLDQENFYTMPDTANLEEKNFCSQSISSIRMDLDSMFEEYSSLSSILPSQLEPIEESYNKIDTMDTNAKKMFLSIFRRLKKLVDKQDKTEEPIQQLDLPKPIIKTIEEPKSILKKKVEVVVEEQECDECNDIEEFMPYSKFIKLQVETKLDYLASFFDNFDKHTFDNYGSLYDLFEKSNSGDEFNSLYNQILYYRDKLITTNEENEEITSINDEEEDEDMNYDI